MKHFKNQGIEFLFPAPEYLGMNLCESGVIKLIKKHGKIPELKHLFRYKKRILDNAKQLSSENGQIFYKKIQKDISPTRLRMYYDFEIKATTYVIDKIIAHGLKQMKNGKWNENRKDFYIRDPGVTEM